jgi:cytochrome P450 family 4 subfamily V
MSITMQVIEERSEQLDEALKNQSGKVTLEDLQTDKPFRIGKQKRLAFLDMLLIAAKGGADIDHDGIQEEVDTFMFEVWDILIGILNKFNSNETAFKCSPWRCRLTLCQGHDTTAAAANWCVYMFGRKPEIQERAQDEQDQIFGGLVSGYM